MSLKNKPRQDEIRGMPKQSAQKEPDSVKKINSDSEQRKIDSIKQEQSAENIRTRCKICFKETYPNPQCAGHGGGGGNSGGGSSGENAGKSGTPFPTNNSDQLLKTTDQLANITTQTIDSGDLFTDEYPLFNTEIISDLLSKKLLVIDNDEERGTLTIKLQYKPNLLPEEERNQLKKFFNSILKELNDFKNEKGISANCFTIEKDSEGNLLSLRITLPTPTVYDEFIQRLASKNLLPTLNIEQKDKVTYQEGLNHFNHTPFSTKPTPGMSKKKKSADEDDHQKAILCASKQAKKPASIRPRSLLDGLKPKGWE